MCSLRRISFNGQLLTAWMVCVALLSDSCFGQGVTVTFSKEIRAQPFSGSIYLFFAKQNPEPRTGPNWFHPEPFLRTEVTNMMPGDELVIDISDPAVLTFPKSLRLNDLRGMNVQAVARFNSWERTVGTGIGNGFSKTQQFDPTKPLQLTINQAVAARKFPETTDQTLFQVRSELMSDFYQQDVDIQAGVLLPKSYAKDPSRRYPVIYEIPGFGGNHFHIQRRSNNESNQLGVEFIRVMLNPDCPLGHHVFANSANNGPWNDALIQEFLPAFDRKFRTIAEPRGRFLTGHSSGGWSSLWIMVTNPKTFAGTWSTAPDPVDFRDFQRINLYAPHQSMFVDDQGEQRPLARTQGKVIVWYQQFSDMEHVLGPGGQLHSFEAVFSPQGPDGKPLQLWDRETGAIDQKVALSWQPYDIRLLLEPTPKTFDPQLLEKLHVFMGTADTFYLEGATQLLKESLSGTAATVEMIPDRDHMNLFQGGLRRRIEQDMAETFLHSK